MVWALTRDKTNPTGEQERPAILNQPGPRSELKRCLGVPLDHPNVLRAWRHLDPFLPSDASPTEERAFVTVSALMCAQPPAARVLDRRPKREFEEAASLGASLALSVSQRNQSDRAAEHRLILLSRQNLNGIHRLLPRTVLHLRGTQIPVDWRHLIEDLATWPTSRRRTATRWVRDYHRTLNRKKNDEDTQPKEPESETQL